MTNYFTKKLTKTARELYDLARTPDRSNDASYRPPPQPSYGVSQQQSYQAPALQYPYQPGQSYPLPQGSHQGFGIQQLFPGFPQQYGQTSPGAAYQVPAYSPAAMHSQWPPGQIASPQSWASSSPNVMSPVQHTPTPPTYLGQPATQPSPAGPVAAPFSPQLGSPQQMSGSPSPLSTPDTLQAQQQSHNHTSSPPLQQPGTGQADSHTYTGNPTQQHTASPVPPEITIAELSADSHSAVNRKPVAGDSSELPGSPLAGQVEPGLAAPLQVPQVASSSRPATPYSPHPNHPEPQVERHGSAAPANAAAPSPQGHIPPLSPSPALLPASSGPSGPMPPTRSPVPSNSGSNTQQPTAAPYFPPPPPQHPQRKLQSSQPPPLPPRQTSDPAAGRAATHYDQNPPYNPSTPYANAPAPQPQQYNPYNFQTMASALPQVHSPLSPNGQGYNPPWSPSSHQPQMGAVPITTSSYPGQPSQVIQYASIPHDLQPAPTSFSPPPNPPSPAASRTRKVTTADGPMPRKLRVQGSQNGPRVRKILSLDGGGVRGYSSLMILDQLMRKLGKQRGEILQPWEEFDMIAGTSTGGLIAIMLGRLQMSVSECIEAYRDLSSRVFKERRNALNAMAKASDLVHLKGRFDPQPMEDCVKEMLAKKGMSASELLREEDNPDACKVFVCAVQAKNTEAICIRSYEGTSDYDMLYDVCQVWEAARATSAASTFFPPIQIGRQKFVDGALRHNNPVKLVDRESRDLWPGEDRLIISIGTGAAPGPDISGDLKDLAKALAKIATETEITNNEFRESHRDMIEEGRLYRFNVQQGLSEVGLEEHRHTDAIEAHTISYLNNWDTKRDMETCVRSMKDSGQRLDIIAGEELKTHLRIEELSTTFCEFCENCTQGISYNSASYLCVECQMVCCEDCHSDHDRTHFPKMMRFEIRQWMPKLKDIDEAVSCRHCAKLSRIRWECVDCHKALCRQCVGEFDVRTTFFTQHQGEHPGGRAFMSLYPPYWTTTAAWIRSSGCPCTTVQPGCLAHCERCHEVLYIGARNYDCATCKKEFGYAQTLCGRCFEEEDPKHKALHEFISWDLFYDASFGCDDPKKLDKDVWRCPQCPGLRIADGQEHRHPHRQLQVIMSPLLLEVTHIMNYRTCHRKELTETAVEPADPCARWKCNLCQHLFGFDANTTIAVCPSTRCLWGFCPTCVQMGRVRHRHRTLTATVQRPPQGNINSVTCQVCKKLIMVMIYQGLWCEDCDYYNVCLTCLAKVQEGKMTLAEGLAHPKLLKPCKARRWILYRLE